MCIVQCALCNVHSAICVVEFVHKAMSTNTPIYTMEVKRALFGPFFSKISEKSVSFFKRTKCKEGKSRKVRQQFWDMGGDLGFF